MQFPTSKSIIDYLLKTAEKGLRYTYEDIGPKEMTLPESETILTPSERDLIRKQLPHEILYPLDPIRGNPSYISPSTLVKYLNRVGDGIFKYIVLTRYSREPYTSDTVTLYAGIYSIKRHEESLPFTIDPKNPIPTIVYLGLIQEILQEYGHSNLSGSFNAVQFRKLAQTNLLISPLSTGDVEDQRTLYSWYADAVYTTHVGGYMGYFNEYSVMIEVTDRLYNPKNLHYNGLGTELDRLHINWRTLPEIEDFRLEDFESEDAMIDAIIPIIEKTLHTEYERVYAYGGPQYREHFDEWERREGRLSENCDAKSYATLEGYVRNVIPHLNLREICEILDRHKAILQGYESPCIEYSREELLPLLEELLSYLPKSDLCSILRTYGPRYSFEYNV